MTYPRRAGLTLMELMIVLAILIALLAIILPGIFVVQARWYVRQADLQIQNLQGYLETYSIDNRGYPTNEQGLYALAYIPDNVGVLPTVPQTGMTGAVDPALGGMGGGSTGVGAEALPNPAASPMGTPAGTLPGAMPGADPMGAAAGGMSAAPGMMPDPTGMGTGGVGGTGMTTTAYTQPFHNPQLYLQQRKRPEATSYIPNLDGLTDPWGLPYRYDNSQQYYGLNETGTSKPAIWSAGPDKTDKTDDDVRSWDPVVAGQAIALRQQQMQGGMATGQAGTIDPMTGMPMQTGTPPMQGMPAQTGLLPMTAPTGAPPMQGMPAQGGLPPMTAPTGAPPMQGMPAQGGLPPMTAPTGAPPMQGLPTQGGAPMPTPAGVPPM